MMRNVIILLILAAFILSAPAMAIKKVPKSDGRPGVESKNPDQTGQPSGQQPPAPQPTKNQSDHRSGGGSDGRDKSPPAEPRKPSNDDSGQRERSKDKDRFIDENDDGLNDGYKKPPEKVKRKKESDSSSNEKQSKSKLGR
jgi:hypothetical protein